MTIETLFPEVCNLFGDSKNEEYLRMTVPDAGFIDDALPDEPYFVRNAPDLMLIGSMTEKLQRQITEKLRPYTDRIRELIDSGTVILATGNAGEIFMKHISYVTEKIETDGLGLINLTVKTDLFNRLNGKVLGKSDDLDIVGFQSRFSQVYGDNSASPFLKVERGVGYNTGNTKYEGVRLNNLFCTSVLGPLLPNNPLFTERLLSLAGTKADAAFREEALAAYEQRLKEFRDPTTEF